jgi:hypothetical protein
MRVHNTAGQYVQSATTTFTTSESVTHYTYTENNTYTTNTIKVTGGSMPAQFFNWSGTSSQNVTLVAVYANISLINSNTVTEKRNPLLVLYQATTASIRSYTPLYDLVPLRGLSGSLGYLGEYWTPTGTGNTGYDYANNNQKLSIQGSGKLTGTWATNEQINVYCIVVYTQRTTNYI